VSIASHHDQDGNCPTCHRSMLIGRAPAPQAVKVANLGGSAASSPEGKPARTRIVAGEPYPVKDYGDGIDGSYLCRCATCSTTFIGHKRDVVCPACVRPAPPQAVKQATPSPAPQAPPPEGIDAERARLLHEALCKVGYLAPESRTIEAAESIAKAALEADRVMVQPHAAGERP
jgi:hypothetical protein